MDEKVDDIEQNIWKLSHDSQIIHEELPILRLGLTARTLQLVVDEVTENKRERMTRKMDMCSTHLGAGIAHSSKRIKKLTVNRDHAFPILVLTHE